MFAELTVKTLSPQHEGKGGGENLESNSTVCGPSKRNTRGTTLRNALPIHLKLSQDEMPISEELKEGSVNELKCDKEGSKKNA